VTDDIVIQSWELLDLALTLQLSHKIFGASYRINGKSKTSRILRWGFKNPQDG